MRGKKPPTHSHPPDLFGIIPVSTADVRLWLATVANINPDSRRAEHYARTWNVTEKCAAAKARGEWPPTR